MNEKSPYEELLIRFLDGGMSSAEEDKVLRLLEENRIARDCLRDLSEQAVAVADLERIRVEARHQSGGRVDSFADGDDQVFLRRFLQVSFKFVLPIAALITLLALVVKGMMFGDTEPFLRIAKVSSVCHLYSAHGTIEDHPKTNMPIMEGDTVESRSCDSWLELQLGTGSRITLVGHSYLQNMEKVGQTIQLRFLTGSMWAEVSEETDMESFNIQTPTCLIQLKNAQFDLHTERFYTRLRVNKGAATVTRILDQVRRGVQAGEQIEVTLDQSKAFIAKAQPAPVNHWQCHLLKGPDITLGQVLPSFEPDFANIKAEPLPWKVSKDQHVMLYAAAFSVSRSSDQAVLLQPGSKLRYYISYDQPERVRFGFSTQRMRGVYAGKFEIDLQPQELGAAGEMVMVELSIDRFWPLNPKLSPEPEGLEVSDIYALTINHDAGLKVHRIQIVPPQ